MEKYNKNNRHTKNILNIGRCVSSYKLTSRQNYFPSRSLGIILKSNFSALFVKRFAQVIS